MNNKELVKIRAEKAAEKAAMTEEDILYAKKIKRDIRKGVLPRFHFKQETKLTNRRQEVRNWKKDVLVSTYAVLTKK